MIFLFLGLEVGEARKMLESFKSENNFSPEVWFEKHPQHPEHEVGLGFLFSLRRNREIVFKAVLKMGFLQLNFFPLKSLVWPLATSDKITLFQSMQY